MNDSFYQETMEKSLEAQKNDLRLRDCTDITGLLQRNYMLNALLENDVTVKNPYIFKLIKDGKSILVLGTIHTLPINVYPLNLQKILGNQFILISETGGYSLSSYIQQLSGAKQDLNKTTSSGSNTKSVIEDGNKPNADELPNWFENLTEHQQNYIVDVIGFLPNKNCTPQYILNRVNSEFYKAINMDNQLFNAFSQARIRMAFSLEDEASREKADLGVKQEVKFEDVHSLTIRKSILNLQYLKELSDLMNTCINSHGYLNSNNSLNAQLTYLKGEMSQSILDYFSKYDAAHIRNYNWAELLCKFFNEPFMMYGVDQSASMLVAVGVGHLYGKENLLEIMHDNYGFNIEKADLAGNFSPYDLEV